MKNYTAWDIEPMKSLDGVSKEDILRHLIGWAILAPSTHNVQPWRFRIFPDKMEIELFLHPFGILPISDKVCREAHISMGCVLENLLIAASHYGLTAETTYSMSKYPEPIARIKLSDGDSFITKDFSMPILHLKHRAMNRGLYIQDKAVPKDFILEASRLASRAGLEFNLIQDAITRFVIAEIQYTADRYVMAKNDFRAELADYFLENDSTEPKGMPGNTFGLNDEMARRVSKELRKTGVFDHDLAVGMAMSARNGIRSSPVIGILRATDDVPYWWLVAGRVFQRIILVAEQMQLSVAVHAAIVEVNTFNELLRMRLGGPYRPIIIFRVGHSVDVGVHSPRYDVSEVLI